MHQPESPKYSPKAQGLLHIVFRLSTFERPFESHTQVFMLVFQSIQPGGLFWTREFWFYLLRECQNRPPGWIDWNTSMKTCVWLSNGRSNVERRNTIWRRPCALGEYFGDSGWCMVT